MTVVIDVGCARYGGDYSIERLIEEFRPDVVYGFDPSPAVKTGVSVVDGCKVAQWRKAAWTHDGEVGYYGSGLGGAVTEEDGQERVPCMDLAAFIDELGPEKVVLKIDAEGAEYELLEHLIREGVDTQLELAWVEWHDLPDGSHEVRRARIEETIGCEIQEWKW